MDPRYLKMWVKLVTVAIGLAVTIWSLRAAPLLGGGSGPASPGGLAHNGIAGACQEQRLAGQIDGSTGGSSAGTLATSGVSGGARALLRELDGSSLACPSTPG